MISLLAIKPFLQIFLLSPTMIMLSSPSASSTAREVQQKVK